MTNELTPQELIVWLSTLPTNKRTCLDCGAGHGEIASWLASHYDKTYALDVVERPIPDARNLQFVLGDANEIPFKNNSFSLVVSMQSLHHFDVDKHLSSVHSVLELHGIFASLCWGEIILPKVVSDAYQCVFEVIEPYWEPERDWVTSGYAGLPFEGKKIELPRTRHKKYVNLDQFEDIIASWSSFKHAAETGVDIPEPETEQAGLDDDYLFEVSWPVLGQIFRKH